MAKQRTLAGGRLTLRFADVSSPLADAEIPAMLRTTLEAFRSTEPYTPIKVIRLRYFAQMPQGVIITGGEGTMQLVYNAVTGRRAGMPSLAILLPANHSVGKNTS